jgi:hypothetical protein
MKRILTILVLLVTVSLVGPPTGTAWASDPDAVEVPSQDVKSGDLNGSLNGPDGDPDGMGTGNGLTDGDPLVQANGTQGTMSAEEIALYLLSLIEMLAL